MVAPNPVGKIKIELRIIADSRPGDLWILLAPVVIVEAWVRAEAELAVM
jgi:hypothetical protein